MKAQRIDEMVKSIKPNIRFREDMDGFAKRECEEVISQLWEIQEKKLRQALTQAHQVGREEERERIRKEPALINHPDLDTLYISTDDTI